MPELNLLPSSLDIKCIAGDDVQVFATFVEDYGCNRILADLTGMTFAAAFKVGTTVYSATVSADASIGRVSITWSDTQTVSAGVGFYKWYLTETLGEVTKTRLAGNFQVVSRN